ncbi:MAG: tRNA (5-methylaminomethyl-2-thiouridine)(34)-methyltransferase MnmD [Sphingobacteriaceae bacterium]|nr:tRNA (5-methylaminomethyl-2-thiouridine)(34)-methyltransferase MnmD [Sphingobacteriaceae bacterium]
MSAPKLEFVTTADGSKTIFNPLVGENYHSKHGALQESRHVFLRSGLEFFLEKNPGNDVSILEVGFGTGLNFLLSADYCTRNRLNLSYTGIEAYPLTPEMIAATEYESYIDVSLYQSFLSQYSESLSRELSLNHYSRLEIAPVELLNFNTEKTFDVLYFDAFAAIHQPEMWTDEALAHCCLFLKPGGIFVTYAITGNLKRSMKSLNFSIEKAPGAPGKREMLRATKK